MICPPAPLPRVDIKAQVGKIAGALAGMKAVETNCTISHCPLLCIHNKKQYQFHLRILFIKQQKLILLTLSSHLFIFYMTK